MAGGVIGGLIAFAWHAPGGPKTWDDVRSWATFFVLPLGFSVAAYELNLQRRLQFDGQAARQEATDDLLDRQRREMTRTELARQREQAERVTVYWYPSADDLAEVHNKSKRPITRIAAEVTVALPEGGMVTHHANACTKLDSEPAFPTASARPGVMSLIPPGSEGEFRFPYSGDDQDARLLVRFCDDAGQRWQLDHLMHLELVPDNDW